MKSTLVIFQCCKKKGDTELYSDDDFNLQVRIPRTSSILTNSIKRFFCKGVINTSSQPITALSRYDGHFYNTTGLRSRVAREVRHGSFQFLIMSAGYGFVHPFQRIRRYEQRMKGKITRYWLNVGLPKVLEEFLETGGYKRAYGLFSKSADYRKIFEEVSWHKFKGFEEAGYFYLEGIRSTSKILRSSAMLMLKLLNKNFMGKTRYFAGGNVVFVKII